MKKVFIIDGKRSPIGSYLGSLAEVHPRHFGSQVLRSMLHDHQIPLEDIDEVV